MQAIFLEHTSTVWQHDKGTLETTQEGPRLWLDPRKDCRCQLCPWHTVLRHREVALTQVREVGAVCNIMKDDRDTSFLFFDSKIHLPSHGDTAIITGTAYFNNCFVWVKREEMARPVLQHQGLVKDEAQLCVWMLTDAQALVLWPELQREKETSGLEVGGA